jgi:hypothetical protein
MNSRMRSARFFAPNFFIMFARWNSTVRGLIPSSCAIFLLVSPPTTRANTVKKSGRGSIVWTYQVNLLTPVPHGFGPSAGKTPLKKGKYVSRTWRGTSYFYQGSRKGRGWALWEILGVTGRKPSLSASTAYSSWYRQGPSAGRRNRKSRRASQPRRLCLGAEILLERL